MKSTTRPKVNGPKPHFSEHHVAAAHSFRQFLGKQENASDKVSRNGARRDWLITRAFASTTSTLEILNCLQTAITLRLSYVLSPLLLVPVGIPKNVINRNAQIYFWLFGVLCSSGKDGVS